MFRSPLTSADSPGSPLVYSATKLNKTPLSTRRGASITDQEYIFVSYIQNDACNLLRYNTHNLTKIKNKIYKFLSVIVLKSQGKKYKAM